MYRPSTFLFILCFSELLCRTISSGTDPDLICHTSSRDECYPRIFVPTDEFQIVREDQAIPPGLHVRLDIVTGQKEAKLYDPAADADDAEYEAVQVVPGEGPVNVPVDPGSRGAGSPMDEDYPLAGDSASSYGPIKPPTTYSEDAPVFKSAITALLQEPVPADLTTSLNELRDLTGDMYWGLQLASDVEAVRKLAGFAAAPAPDFERSTLATRILASAARNNAPALSAMLAYDPPLWDIGTSGASGSLWDIVLYGLHLNTPQSEDTSNPHISASLEPKAYEGYISLLSSLLSGSSESRTEWIDRATRLASPRHFDAAEAGQSAEWDRARKRVLALIADHYLPTDSGTPVGEGKVTRLAELSTYPYCTLLREWLGACEGARHGWRDDSEDQQLATELKETIERVMKESWEDGGCKGVPEGTAQTEQHASRRPTIKEDL